MHRTAASPLALLYAVLVVYASLYPFTDWRDQGVDVGAFLVAPFPRYWTGFDVSVNLAGYVPLGGLVALWVLRSRSGAHPVRTGLLAVCALSLCMETLQTFLPSRVASREDWLLNSAGGWIGAAAAVALAQTGAIDHWSRVRARWFVPGARGGLVLLATWPVALLFPPAVPFGLGQVLERLEAELARHLTGTPLLEWLPQRNTVLQPLAPSGEMVCVFLGLLVPVLLGFSCIRALQRRLLFVPLLFVTGILVTGFSSAMSWGPLHAWSWLDLPAQIGILAAFFAALLLAMLPLRASTALVFLALGVSLSLLNLAPESPYFAQTLQEWEQGRFIRFHGLAQWVGWIWPYAALVYAFAQTWRQGPEN